MRQDIMTEECPNCKQTTNSSFSRLVKDTCGHAKCRMCLLYEEQGCRTCHEKYNIQNIGNYDCPTSGNQITNISDTKNSNVTEEMILPLELVINKDSKPKEIHLKHISLDCTNELEVHNDSFNDSKEQYELPTEINCTKVSEDLYISKIEHCDVVTNINTHLDDTVIPEDLQTTYNDTPRNSDSKVESKFDEKEKSLKSKYLKCPDRSHISVLPGFPERYKCNICNKVFKNKKGKCYHDACITGVRPYQCTFCDRSFVKRSHFEYHERVHRGYKPYKCNLCEKAFPQQNKLNRHMFSHSTEKQFVCSKCNKGYSKREDLKNHSAIHNSTATYACKACGKSFRILANLKRHTRTHTNERPHTCDQCNKSFKDKSLLVRHKRTHGKERPFSCAHCNRVFLSKSELRRHLTVHSDEKPFSCEYCQTVFRRKDNLNRHIRHHHSEDSTFDTNRPQATVPDTNKKILKTKQINPKQKQKPKKTQRISSSSLPKSSTKVSVVYINSRDQINSRLDSMGNITPVIRTTNEVSNAVPVINGPISIKKPEDKTDTRKKTFTHTEPIPLAEAVVINRRIEEKLYPQNASNHNYFFRNYTNRVDKPAFVTNNTSRSNLCTRSNSSGKISGIEPASSSQMNFPSAESGSCENVKDTVIENQVCTNTEDNNRANESTDNFVLKLTNIAQSDFSKGDGHSTNIQEQTNCVSTIKKHILLQSQSNVYKGINGGYDVTSNDSLPKTIGHNEKKQCNVHWRRRTAEALKTPNS